MGSVPFNMNLLKKEYEKLYDMGVGGTQEPFFIYIKSYVENNTLP